MAGVQDRTVQVQKKYHFTEIPNASHYWLRNATVPCCCLCVEGADLSADYDGCCRVDIEVRNGKIESIVASEECSSQLRGATAIVDLAGSMCFPTFADLHTHIDKGHTCERSPNPCATLYGADRSTARDANFWDAEDVYRRMDFSLKCAYAHGTSALRTHLINMTPKQLELTWPVFGALRKKWQGKVELQGVSLVTLSHFRDLAFAERIADIVAYYGGLMGAAVCCSDNGGLAEDDSTTCDADRDALLDRVFELAKRRGLMLDFHVDENGNEQAKGLRYVARKTIEHSYQGKVVCGHCCSLAMQSEEDLAYTLALAREAEVTVVSLPLVNEWTQDRCRDGGRTPRWRGITTLHELRAAGVRTAIASDNTRDQFYAYGDLDMVEVFTQGVRIGHLDRPYADWPLAVTAAPAAAMGLPRGAGLLSVGGVADLVLFRGRRFSELLSRPQHDRVVVRAGEALVEGPPDYRELDFDVAAQRYRQPLVCGKQLLLELQGLPLPVQVQVQVGRKRKTVSDGDADSSPSSATHVDAEPSSSSGDEALPLLVPAEPAPPPCGRGDEHGAPAVARPEADGISCGCSTFRLRCGVGNAA